MLETDIPPPKNPLTVRLNQMVLGYVFDGFMKKNLPELSAVVTSEYRTPERNEQVGGAANSAHVHGLARDVTFRVRATGAKLSESEAKAVYDQVFAPRWPGFSEWEGSSAGEGYHVHVNLSREVTTYSGIVALAGIGVAGLLIAHNWGKSA